MANKILSKKPEEEISILDYYENDNFDQLNLMLHQYFIGAITPDLYDLLELLSMTKDTILLKKIVLIITLFQPFFISDLISVYNLEESVFMKNILLSIISSQINLVNIPFLIDQYIKNEKFRNKIKVKLIEEPETTFLALVNYLEMKRDFLLPEDLEFAKELLSCLNPKYYYLYAASLTNLMISDLFYSINPDKFPND
ncbi:MAG: hypothetical protein WC860_01065 [Candidatus Margulisiibacteriota bacterium]|jgi:hypothetical protein